MSVKINLAANGFVGVTDLNAGQLVPDVVARTININYVYALLSNADDDDYTINLPAPGANDEFAGSVIIFKNLTSDDTTVTIGRQDGINIDGLAEDVITNVVGQVLSFYYINEDIGWMAGPAVL